MPRRVAGRSRRPTPGVPAAPAVPPPAPWHHRWWNRITKTILGLGAVAAAIGAVVSLWPAPDPEDSAHLTAVRIIAGVPLGEYRDRSSVTGTPPVLRRAASLPLGGSASSTRPRTTVSPRPTSATAPTTSTRATSATTSPTMTSSTMTPSPTTTPDTPPTIPILESGFVLPEDTTPDAVTYVAGAGAARSAPVPGLVAASTQALTPMAISHLRGPTGEPVSPVVAAERLVQVLKDSRTTDAADAEPLGVVISADIELVGLRGRPVLLSWSMWQKGGDVRLHGEWLNSNLAYHLRAGTERDTATVDLWVPLPRPPGPYVVRVDLTTDGIRLASGDSEPFE